MPVLLSTVDRIIEDMVKDVGALPYCMVHAIVSKHIQQARGEIIEAAQQLWVEKGIKYNKKIKYD